MTLSKESFVSGINAMAEHCPENGIISVSFSVIEGRISSIRLSKTFDILTEGSASEFCGDRIFTDDVKHKIFTDLENLRLQYGTIEVKIEVHNGRLRNYCVIPSFTLSENLLNAQIRHHKNKQLTKNHQAA